MAAEPGQGRADVLVGPDVDPRRQPLPGDGPRQGPLGYGRPRCLEAALPLGVSPRDSAAPFLGRSDDL